MSQPHQRRPDPRMTKVIAVTALGVVVPGLTWLSQYSGGPLKWWQPLALSGSILTGLIFIGKSGAADKNVLLKTFGLPKNW